MSSLALLPNTSIEDDNIFIRPESLDIQSTSSNEHPTLKNLIRGKWNGRLVVVKRLPVDVSEEVLERLARKWRQCSHVNVSRVYGIADHASDPLFMVLPFYEHGNVHQYLTRISQSSNRQRMILEIASGMQHLHNNGIIHGGLRPTNIFMTADGHIVISEYGLFELQQTTRDTEAYRYFSPETWKGTVSKPSDVYSFAMCALQILTSVLPWGSLSEKYVFSLVVYEKTRPDRPETSRLTDDIWNIIVSAWHQEPGYRPTFDLIVRLWRANSLQIEPIQTTRTSSFHMSRYHSGVSVGSGSDHSVGPPAYEDEHMPTPENMPTSAPPATQQFAFNGTETATSPAEARPHGYSWYSSANSRDSIGNSPPNSAPPISLQFPINEGAGNRAVERTPPNTAPPGHQFPSNEDITNFSMRPQSPSHSWFSTRGVAPQSSGSSSSDRSLDSPVTSLESPMSTHRSRARLSFSPKHVYGTASPRDDASSAFHRIGHNLGQALPRLDPIQSQDEYTPRWELASPSSYGGLRRQRSFSDISIKTESSGTKSRSPSPILLVGALQAELNGSRNMDAIDSCLVKIHQVASESDWGAHKLVTAGAAPALIHLLKTRAAEIDGLEIVLITLGALAHDSISANTIYRTNTAITLIELCKSSISCEVSVLSIWCLIRICRSAEVAQGLIKANIVPVLLKQSALGDVHLDAMSVYCLGTLVQNDASAELLSLMDIIPFVVNHLRQSTESPTQNSDHICAGLYAIARISRSIKLAKSLAKAGCIDLLSYHLRTSDDPNVLNYSCRAIGCLMRPNSSDMAKVLLEADIAKGLARLPTVLSSGKLQALGSLGFAVQRFSCAEWSGKIRQTLVEAGVVDSLLAALRTASEEPCYDVHIELALGLSLLGDVGGSSIRKEIVNAGGITILKAVAHNNTDVAKACNTAITSISGNIWSRNAASAKTAMAHNWNGGCPDYLPPCPLVLQVF